MRPAWHETLEEWIQSCKTGDTRDAIDEWLLSSGTTRWLAGARFEDRKRTQDRGEQEGVGTPCPKTGETPMLFSIADFIDSRGVRLRAPLPCTKDIRSHSHKPLNHSFHLSTQSATAPPTCCNQSCLCPALRLQHCGPRTSTFQILVCC